MTLSGIEHVSNDADNTAEGAVSVCPYEHVFVGCVSSIWSSAFAKHYNFCVFTFEGGHNV